MSTNAEQRSAQLPLEQFRDWLDHGTGPLALSGRGWNHILVRLPRAEDIDYIFDQRSYWGKERGKITFRDRFEFACLYDRTHKQLYGDPRFGEAVADMESMGVQSFEALKAQAQAAVNRLVEQRIGNDRNNLSVKSTTHADTKRWLEQRTYGAREEARRCFFDGGEMADIHFTSDYRTGEWSEDAILSYVRDPAAYVRREAELYIRDHQEDFLAQFLENDALLSQWQALLDNPDDPIHRMKAIKDAVQSCGGKTVSVTVQKEGKELTFHTEADSLTRLDSYYSTYSIRAQDRRGFEELFGRYSHYTARDIIRIAYGRQTIYEPPAPEQAQAEEPAQGITMGGMGSQGL